MATKFVNAKSTGGTGNNSVPASRTLLYTAPSTGTFPVAIVFDGKIANIDTTLQADHNITLEIRSGADYFPVLQSIPIPYGSSLAPGKITLQSGESLYCSADALNALTITLSILEKN